MVQEHKSLDEENEKQNTSLARLSCACEHSHCWHKPITPQCELLISGWRRIKFKLNFLAKMRRNLFCHVKKWWWLFIDKVSYKRHRIQTPINYDTQTDTHVKVSVMITSLCAFSDYNTYQFIYIYIVSVLVGSLKDIIIPILDSSRRHLNLHIHFQSSA